MEAGGKLREVASVRRLGELARMVMMLLMVGLAVVLTGAIVIMVVSLVLRGSRLVDVTALRPKNPTVVLAGDWQSWVLSLIAIDIVILCGARPLGTVLNRSLWRRTMREGGGREGGEDNRRGGEKGGREICGQHLYFTNVGACNTNPPLAGRIAAVMSTRDVLWAISNPIRAALRQLLSILKQHWALFQAIKIYYIDIAAS